MCNNVDVKGFETVVFSIFMPCYVLSLKNPVTQTKGGRLQSWHFLMYM